MNYKFKNNIILIDIAELHIAASLTAVFLPYLIIKTGGILLHRYFDEFILGANYWPRNHGIEMWKEWDREEIKEEFEEAKKLGLNVLRINLFWEDFQPEPEVISEDAVKKFDELINICHEVSIKIAPTFFVGHMSGENWDVPWRNGRDIYSNPFMLRAEARLVRFFAKRYGDEKAILFWDLSNEPDNYVNPASRDDSWLWNYMLSNEIKKYDKNHPVTLGIHLQSLVSDNNIYPEDIAEGNDFLCMHAYPIYSDTCMDPVNSIRSTYMLPFTLKLTRGMGQKDVMLEEFGATTLMMSEKIEGKYYKTVLYSLLASGAIGALAWCFGDFSQSERLPYNTSPFETEFGITDCSGRPKIAALEMKAFSQFINSFKSGDMECSKPYAAIIIPDRYYNSHFVGGDYTAERNFRALYNSFILSKEAGMDVEFVRADEDFTRYSILILPSVYRKSYLNVDQWHRVEEFVENGGTIYTSYDGMAVEGFDNVFGVETQYFMVPRGKYVNINFEKLGSRLSYDALKYNKRLICSTNHGEAEGFDDDGNPAIIVNRYGKGRAVLVTYPVELYLSYMPDVYRNDETYKIYKLAKQLSGVHNNFELDSPFVETKSMKCGSDDFVLVINHADTDITANTNKKGYAEDLISKRKIPIAKIEIKAGEVMALKFID